ncbi:Asp/Glu racemase [Loktanella sp. SALINAS62]|nr:Asp/Glu racemase [Loktanella sp. SALINAS62]
MNPNSNAATTDVMCRIAATCLLNAPVPWTAPVGPKMITTAKALCAAADIIAKAEIHDWPDMIIVAAFGDPGALRLARRAPCPVIGIGAAAAREVASTGAAFAVATTTPSLVPSIDGLMMSHAQGATYVGCFCANDDPDVLMLDAQALDAALLVQIARAADAGAQHVIIGGGPLGAAAERLRDVSPVPLINPILSAARAVQRTIENKHVQNR